MLISYFNSLSVVERDCLQLSLHMISNTNIIYTLVRIAEVNYDPKANYQFGYVLGAVLFDWKQDINYPVSRNVLSKQVVQSITNVRR